MLASCSAPDGVLSSSYAVLQQSLTRRCRCQLILQLTHMLRICQVFCDLLWMLIIADDAAFLV